MDSCSICLRKNIPVYVGTQKRKYLLKCPYCKTLFFQKVSTVTYNSSYFNNEYKEQYGKTYLEDKENIQKRMKWRLNLLKKITTLEGKTLLEIGCAAGFFLELAQQEGMITKGWEISSEMTHPKKKNIEYKEGDFLTLYKRNIVPQHNIDILATFYVLEHIPHQKECWEAFQYLVKPNGYLLLSLPSYYGPTYYYNYSQWKNSHPKDHYIDYSPKSIKKVARQFSFYPLLFKSEGIHPMRFPLGKYQPFSSIYKIIQNKIPFSDTFFTILQKVKN